MDRANKMMVAILLLTLNEAGELINLTFVTVNAYKSVLVIFSSWAQ